MRLQLWVPLIPQIRLTPKELELPSNGMFGRYDLVQLQRGFKVYSEVCSNCHSLAHVAFRDLKKIGRDHVGEVLLEKIHDAIEKVDLTEGAKFLDRDFALQAATDAGPLVNMCKRTTARRKIDPVAPDQPLL